jgi:hypothetical protein
MNYNYEEFFAIFKGVSNEVEKRRRSYLFRFYLLVISSVVLPVIAFIYISSLAILLKTYVLLDFEIQDIKVMLIILAAVLTVLFFKLGIKQIIAYKGDESNAGFLPNKYTLKDHIYSKLARYFGSFAFAPSADKVYQDLAYATIIPEHDSYKIEDCIKGTINDTTAYISEAKFSKLVNGEKHSVFEGVLIIIDICDVNVKLRGEFSGKSVVIADRQKNISNIVEKYKDYSQISLPQKYEASLEAFSTNENEFRAIVNELVLKEIEGISVFINTLAKQTQHFDSKLSYALNKIFIESQSTTRGISEFEKGAIPAEDLDLTKLDKIDESPSSANTSVQIEIVKDKIFITIPEKSDLFEPNSLFEKPLVPEDAQLLFKLMSFVKDLTGVVKTYLDSRHK